ncbi:hypothetical protein [Roseiterribacter gracilis]|uniref:Uncharacterized protein n=1 Tax=Roseiterribacter gracilis TaxID=2812848 RepID=A0A8S8XKB5_9PROT|nr:hypothetical protein TMPK1_34670 [Rhodospirillales bacterium TMPK1]
MRPARPSCRVPAVSTKSKTLLLAACGAALLVLAVVLRFVGTDEPLRLALRDAAMSAAGTGTNRTELPATAELLLLDESGLVLRGPAALQGTRIELDAVRDAQINGNGVAIERWPDGKSWLTAYAATRRSTANTLRIAVVRHPPDRGVPLRASVWIAGAGGLLLLFAAFARSRRAPATFAAATIDDVPLDAPAHDNVVRLEPRPVRATPAATADEEEPLLLEQVVTPDPISDAVDRAIARTPANDRSAPVRPPPLDDNGEIRLVEPTTPLFNDAPLLALQLSVPTDSFERVLQARLADAARRVRILEVAATANDAMTLQREASDLAEFAAAFGAPALQEAVALVTQVAELQLTMAYPSAVTQVANLYRPTEEAITARFIARTG